MSVHFLYFLFKLKGVKPTSLSKKYVENEISNSSSQKKRESERGAKIKSNFKSISKTAQKVSLVTLVTNYHKLTFLPLLP